MTALLQRFTNIRREEVPAVLDVLRRLLRELGVGAGELTRDTYSDAVRAARYGRVNPPRTSP